MESASESHQHPVPASAEPVVVTEADLTSANSTKPAVSTGEQAIETLAKDLQLNLPLTNLPLPDKLLTVFTLVGGLGILGSSLADIFSPEAVVWHLYLLRLFAGISFLAITFGLIHRQRWAIWWYGFLVGLAFLINPPLAFLPAVIVYYLYRQRQLFQPSIFDEWAQEVHRQIVTLFNTIRSPKK